MPGRGTRKVELGVKSSLNDEVARLFEWIESLFGDGSVEGADEDWSPLLQPKS